MTVYEANIKNLFSNWILTLVFISPHDYNLNIIRLETMNLSFIMLLMFLNII